MQSLKKIHAWAQMQDPLLKFPIINDVLYALFNLCFNIGILSSVWKKTMVVPIPKD